MEERSLRPFGFRDKLGYLVGAFGNDFTFILSTSILMKFYTDFMGVSAGAVGLIMMIARFIDAVTDVTMGRICDAAPATRAGKFRPWLLRMCVPVAAASFLMYAPGLAGNVVQSWSQGTKVAYLAVSYILWGSFCYTGINIPYGSMASAISPDPGDRSSLSTYRTMGGMLAGMFIGVGLPLIAYDNVETNGQILSIINGRRVAISALVFSVLAVICYVFAYRLTTERVPYRAEQKVKSSVKSLLMSALKNRSLISIICASVFMLLAQLTIENTPNPSQVSACRAIKPHMVAGRTSQVSTLTATARRLEATEISALPNRRDKGFANADATIMPPIITRDEAV